MPGSRVSCSRIATTLSLILSPAGTGVLSTKSKLTAPLAFDGVDKRYGPGIVAPAIVIAVGVGLNASGSARMSTSLNSRPEGDDTVSVAPLDTSGTTLHCPVSEFRWSTCATTT